MPTARETVTAALAELCLETRDGSPVGDDATMESLGADSLDMIELAMIIEDNHPDLPDGIFDHSVTMQTTVAEIIAIAETAMA